MGHVTLTTPLLTVIILMLGLHIAYLCTKFDDCNLSRSRDMVGAHQTLRGSRDLTTPLSGMVCQQRASTYYDQPNYQI